MAFRRVEWFAGWWLVVELDHEMLRDGHAGWDLDTSLESDGATWQEAEALALEELDRAQQEDGAYEEKGYTRDKLLLIRKVMRSEGHAAQQMMPEDVFEVWR
jgi:hypothetical protein